MRYVTSVERLALQDGIEQGIAQGIEQGIEQGIVRKARIEVLEVRFQFIPQAAIDQIKQLSNPDLLTKLHRQAILAPSLAEFQQTMLKLIPAEEALIATN